MTFNACTMSGQLVQVNETYVCSLMFPLRRWMRLQIASSGRFLPLPSAFRTANRSDVNSWPLGMPRNITPVSSLSFSRENCIVMSSVSTNSALKSWDVEIKSLMNSFSSAAFSCCGCAVTLKVYWWVKSLKTSLTCCRMVVSNIVI